LQSFKIGRVAEWLGRGLQNLLQRFESASDLRVNTLYKIKIMGVTRLKRKDRRNKTTSRLEVQFLKLATNIELGSRSAEKKDSQIAKNNAVLAKAVAASK
jgi:cellulose biosynthesis protein BcsQ